jgi:hypothetical protein
LAAIVRAPASALRDVCWNVIPEIVHSKSNRPRRVVDRFNEASPFGSACVHESRRKRA